MMNCFKEYRGLGSHVLPECMWMYVCMLTICGLCECRCVPRSDNQADWDHIFVTYVKMSMNLMIFIVCFDSND